MFIPPKYINLSEYILDNINEIDIYQYYLNKKIKHIPFKSQSPFHKDEHPSFSLFSKDNHILWKDFTLGITGNVFTFIMKLYNLNYFDSLKKINEDLIIKQISNIIIKQECNTIKNIEKSKIDLVFYYFKDKEIPKSYWNYWNKYKVITKEILDKNNVRCPKYVYLNNNLHFSYKDDDILIRYTWKLKNDNKNYYKVYKPYNNLNKWISNFRGASKWLIHGLDLIDYNCNYIIITKSVKDKMVLEGLNYNAINIQNEGISIPNEIMEKLHNDFSKIYLLYDNDWDKSENWGQLAANNLIQSYPYLINIKINDKYECTDISEFIEKYDEIKSKDLINNLIQKI